MSILKLCHLEKLRTERPWLREFLSEFIGTFFLIFIGNGAMAAFVLKKEHDLFAVLFAWGIAVMFGILAGASNSGGHINPIVTTSYAFLGMIPWKKVPHYLLGQHLGAFAACGLLYVNNRDLMNVFDGGYRNALGANATGILWTTFPDPNVQIHTALLDTIICSGLLMFGIFVVIDKDNGAVPNYLHAFFIGLEVIVICWAFGLNFMCGINPARDFPPRLFAFIIGYKDVFNTSTFWWMPMFVAHLGGLIGTLVYQLFVGIHKPPKMAPLAEIHEINEFIQQQLKKKEKEGRP